MVSSAIQLFRERGVAGTTLSDVVEHSGAPRGSIYYYFPDGKAQLAVEATAHAGRLMTRLIEKSMAARGAAGTITAMIDVTRERLLNTDFASGCPIAAGALEGGGAPEARDAAGSAFSSWEAALATTLREHGTPADRADTLATMIVCAIEGAIIVAKAQRRTQALDRVERELLLVLSNC